MNKIEKTIIAKQPFSEEDLDDVFMNPKLYAHLAQQILVNMINNNQTEYIAQTICNFSGTKAIINFTSIFNKLILSGNATDALKNIKLFTRVGTNINAKKLIQNVIKEGNAWVIALHIDDLIKNGAQIGTDIDLDFIAQNIKSNHKSPVFIESLKLFTDASLVDPTQLFQELMNYGTKNATILLIEKLDNFLQASAHIDIDKLSNNVVEFNLSTDKTLIFRTFSFIVNGHDDDIFNLIEQLAHGSPFEQRILIIFLQKFIDFGISPTFIAKALINAGNENIVLEHLNLFSNSITVQTDLLKTIAEKN